MSSLPSKIIRLSDLPNRRETVVQLEPTAREREAIAADLGIPAVKKLRFDGTLSPLGRRDWRLEAKLGATVVQECVVTLDPVTTRIDEDVNRSYVEDMPEPDAAEVEMPDDDTTDPLPETLDLAGVMIEALALALPPYPRKDDAEIGEAVFTEPGKTPMRDEDARPFAGLADLKNALENKGKEDE